MASKKPKRQKPTKHELPTACLVIDFGHMYVADVERHYNICDELSTLEANMDQYISMGGDEHEVLHISSHIEGLKDRCNQLKGELVRVGNRLKRELDKSSVNADVIVRLQLRDWFDLSLIEDLKVQLDKWRRKQKPVDSKTWRPPDGYVNASAVVAQDGEVVPRTTVSVWASRHPPDHVEKDPISGALYYQQEWINERLKTYQRRKW